MCQHGKTKQQIASRNQTELVSVTIKIIKTDTDTDVAASWGDVGALLEPMQTSFRLWDRLLRQSSVHPWQKSNISFFNSCKSEQKFRDWHVWVFLNCAAVPHKVMNHGVWQLKWEWFDCRIILQSFVCSEFMVTNVNVHNYLWIPLADLSSDNMDIIRITRPSL